jgi:hypothetical protein
MSDSDVQLVLRFVGAATEDHLIDVKDLAPAILHLAEAVERTAQITDPGVRVRLNVRATGEGSFIVEFVLSAWGAVVSFFTSPTGATLSAITGVLLGAISLVQGKSCHGGAPKTIVDEGCLPDEVKITYPDGFIVVTSKKALRVASDSRAIQAMRAMLQPLDNEQLDTLEFSHKDVTVNIETSDVTAFDLTLSEDSIVEETDIQLGVLLQATDVSFRDRGKWRVSDGQSSFFVAVEDEGFLARIDEGVERFGKNDLIRVNIRSYYTFNAARQLKVRRVVEKVIEHFTLNDSAPHIPGV